MSISNITGITSSWQTQGTANSGSAAANVDTGFLQALSAQLTATLASTGGAAPTTTGNAVDATNSSDQLAANRALAGAHYRHHRHGMGGSVTEPQQNASSQPAAGDAQARRPPLSTVSPQIMIQA